MILLASEERHVAEYLASFKETLRSAGALIIFASRVVYKHWLLQSQ